MWSMWRGSTPDASTKANATLDAASLIMPRNTKIDHMLVLHAGSNGYIAGPTGVSESQITGKYIRAKLFADFVKTHVEDDEYADKAKLVKMFTMFENILRRETGVIYSPLETTIVDYATAAAKRTEILNLTGAHRPIEMLDKLRNSYQQYTTKVDIEGRRAIRLRISAYHEANVKQIDLGYDVMDQLKTVRRVLATARTKASYELGGPEDNLVKELLKKIDAIEAYALVLSGTKPLTPTSSGQTDVELLANTPSSDESRVEELDEDDNTSGGGGSG